MFEAYKRTLMVCLRVDGGFGWIKEKIFEVFGVILGLSLSRMNFLSLETGLADFGGWFRG